MLSPKHRSYYLYFEKQHRNGLLKYYDKKLRVYIAIRKLLGKSCTVREFHFLFNNIKVFLGSGLNSPREDKLDSYLRFLDYSHPGIFDNLHFDLTHLMPIEEEIHPWKLRYRSNAQKKRFDIQSSLDRLRRAYKNIPNTAIGFSNN